MTRLNFAHLSGVIVDECPKHGIWLDQGELRKIAVFVAAGGLKDIRDLDVVSPAFRGRAKRERVTKRSDNAERTTWTPWPDLGRRSPETSDFLDFLEFLLYCVSSIVG